MSQRAALLFKTVAYVLTLLLVNAQEERAKQTTAFRDKPFVTVWNAPTQDCKPKFSIILNLTSFDIVSSPNEGFYNQTLTIFYKERLGKYPYYEKQEAVNGGLPQNSSLNDHLSEMDKDIKKYIRSHSMEGLAVIDWEEWRPLWIRNWQSKEIYRKNSKQLVSDKHPDWADDQVSREAQLVFEQSGQKFMAETLQKAKKIRPKTLWGYYLFPDCYNHDYKNNLVNYTGQCPDVEIARNDQLMWLWKNSTAIFPSIYLDPMLRSSANGKKFVRSRVKEAMRVSNLHSANSSLPVFVYTRPTYVHSVDLLSEQDLVTTVGETAALGAAGIIFWGDVAYGKSNVNCRITKDYLDGALGRYLLNVTTATQECSRALCGGNGRCLRKVSDSESYLHLNPASFQLQTLNATGNPKLVVTGKLSQADILQFQDRFRCQCYVGWFGSDCGTKANSAQHTLANGLTLFVALLLSLMVRK
uniref:Hyaluronidase n=1 Tax=Callorhinchus milii TaxID=7868 RepID=V9KNS7_CALMI